jgi:hypothetical protein
MASPVRTLETSRRKRGERIMSSSSEREIRDTLCAYFTTNAPAARIVHELNVNGASSCRADLAIVWESFLLLIEIKSAKDVLKRLPEQAWAFKKASHHFIAVIHQKHFIDAPGFIGERRVLKQHHPENYRETFTIWEYPRPEKQRYRMDFPWRFDFSKPAFSTDTTAPYPLLDLLWRDELYHECAMHRVTVPKRACRSRMMEEMSWHMTGKEVTRAVCRQLRQRQFAEASPAILETV